MEQQLSEGIQNNKSEERDLNVSDKVETPENSHKKQSKLKYLILWIILLLIAVISLVCIYLWSKKDSDDTVPSLQEDAVEDSDDETSSLQEKSDEDTSDQLDKQDNEDELPDLSSNTLENRYILFSHSDELWISNWDGKNQRSLVLRDVSVALNGFNDRWIFYQSKSNGSIQVYDLKDKKIVDTDLEEVKIEGGKGRYYQPFSVSPDGKSIVANFYYTKDNCVEPPCGLEPPASAQDAGYYAYNIETNRKAYLTDILNITFAIWSENSLYFNTHQEILTSGSDGAYDHRNIRFDITSGKEEIIEVTKYPNEWGAEGGINYFIDDFKIRIESSMSKGQARIIYEKDIGQQIVDSSKYTEMQQSLVISPQYDKALYYRGRADDRTPAHVEKDRYLLDFINIDTEMVLSAKENEDLGFNSYWVNNDYFITKVIEDSEQSDPNSAGDILLVNSLNGTSEKITEFGDVQLYGNPLY